MNVYRPDTKYSKTYATEAKAMAATAAAHAKFGLDDLPNSAVHVIPMLTADGRHFCATHIRDQQYLQQGIWLSQLGFHILG